MKTKSIITYFVAGALALPIFAAEEKENEKKPTQPVIQIALLLDTSSSMSGLINQAKSQLWKVVNEFISAKQNGQTPIVQVALYEYGNNGLKGGDYTNWIRQIQPLTRDLDKVSEELFALTTNGGEEYCGAVIQRAARDLKWDKSSDTFKTVFIAGNEPFTQGPIKADEACKEAIGKGIIVNTIHCGTEQAGINGKWKMGALLSDGTFMTINQNKVVPHINAPQDKEIAKWNSELNKTYVVYGKKGAEYKQNQIAQDVNASKAQGGAFSSRAATKASANYWSGAWDLVDACKKEGFKLEDIKAEDLPEEMRKMTIEERKAHLEKMKKTRGEIQKKILALNNDRKKYVAEKLKETGEGDTLDKAMITAIRSQAATKSITFGQ